MTAPLGLRSGVGGLRQRGCFCRAWVPGQSSVVVAVPFGLGQPVDFIHRPIAGGDHKEAALWTIPDVRADAEAHAEQERLAFGDVILGKVVRNAIQQPQVCQGYVTAVRAESQAEELTVGKEKGRAGLAGVELGKARKLDLTPASQSAGGNSTITAQARTPPATAFHVTSPAHGPRSAASSSSLAIRFMPTQSSSSAHLQTTTRPESFSPASTGLGQLRRGSALTGDQDCTSDTAFDTFPWPQFSDSALRTPH